MSASYNRIQAIRSQRVKERLVNSLSKKLMSHIGDFKQYRSGHQLVKNIRTRFMAFDLSELNDEKVEEIRLSEWFNKHYKEHKEHCSEKKQRKQNK